MDAAVLAKAVGKPVRLQYMRDQGTGWDPKAPASIHRARVAIDASGHVVAYDYLSKGFSRVDVDTNGSKPQDTLAGQTLGVALKSGDGFGVPGESYGFANKRTAWETIAPLLDRASPLRSAHLRDPVGPQITFASESFMDEVAATLNVDPIEFRLRYVKDARGRRHGRTRPVTRSPAAASAMPRATVRALRSLPRSMSIVKAGRSGRANSPSRTIAGRSSILTGCITPSRTTSFRV
jgi:hypothetical protein